MESSARFDEVRAQMRTDIRKVLNAEQQARFDAMVAKWDAKRKRLEGDGEK